MAVSLKRAAQRLLPPSLRDHCIVADKNEGFVPCRSPEAGFGYSSTIAWLGLTSVRVNGGFCAICGVTSIDLYVSLDLWMHLVG